MSEYVSSKPLPEGGVGVGYVRRRVNKPWSVAAFALGSLLIALPACTVNQKQEVATYRTLLDQDAPRERVETLAMEEPLTLQHALYLANQNDEQLSIRGESYLQSLIARAKAASGFLPNISASG